MITSLRGLRFGILGMGRSGIGAARLINRLGGTALISDQKPHAMLVEALAALQPISIGIETGAHDKLLAGDFDVIIVSPGAALQAAWLERWDSRRIELWSELELASRCCDVPWIGVTGSNGKTTTVTLLASMLERAGKLVKAVGNIGVAWSDLLPTADLDAFVVEVSSFQMEHASTVHPRTSVLLNVLENHLDRHGDLATYGALKLRLAANQDVADTTVINADDSFLNEQSGLLTGHVERFGRNVERGWQVTQGTLFRKTDSRRDIVLNSPEWALIGEHNLLNAAAAACAAQTLGADLDSIRTALRDARPIEHRIEFVREIEGITYVNDSKSTNLTATLTALNAVEREVILLFGGRAKKESFEPLRSLLGNRVRSLIVFGEARGKIAKELGDDSRVQYVETLAEALTAAQDKAGCGSCVLLSPGCASYDQFNNFEERGSHFKQLVHALKT